MYIHMIYKSIDMILYIYIYIYICVYIYIYTYIHIYLHFIIAKKSYLFPSKIWFVFWKFIFASKVWFSLENMTCSKKVDYLLQKYDLFVCKYNFPRHILFIRKLSSLRPRIWTFRRNPISCFESQIIWLYKAHPKCKTPFSKI